MTTPARATRLNERATAEHTVEKSLPGPSWLLRARQGGTRGRYVWQRATKTAAGAAVGGEW